ncbi:prolyl oligopeptidase family serine peptidase [Nostoc sp. CHAB 5824]|nr:prolyl oligopeptidase family serine peptidase [Nostoc sp. CHAB 5824]
MSDIETLELAGVSLLLRPPKNPNNPAPLIIFWHGFGSPSAEADIAEAFPLSEIQAWKAYLRLPSFGKSSPDELEELMRRQLQDYVLQLLLPVIEPAVQELPKVVEALQRHCNIDSNAGIGIFGFSAGGLAALLALTQSNILIQAAVLAGVTKDLASAVNTYERFMQNSYATLKEQYPWLQPTYSWSEESEKAKTRLDFVNRAKEIVKGNPPPAILFVHGVQDEVFDVDDVKTLHEDLKLYYQQANYPQRLSIRLFKHLKHAVDLAANTSPEQREDIIEMEKAVAGWFGRYLN